MQNWQRYYKVRITYTGRTCSIYRIYFKTYEKSAQWLNTVPYNIKNVEYSDVAY